MLTPENKLMQVMTEVERAPFSVAPCQFNGVGHFGSTMQGLCSPTWWGQVEPMASSQ